MRKIKINSIDENDYTIIHSIAVMPMNTYAVIIDLFEDGFMTTNGFVPDEITIDDSIEKEYIEEFGVVGTIYDSNSLVHLPMKWYEYTWEFLDEYDVVECTGKISTINWGILSTQNTMPAIKYSKSFTNGYYDLDGQAHCKIKLIQK